MINLIITEQASLAACAASAFIDHYFVTSFFKLVVSNEVFSCNIVMRVVHRGRDVGVLLWLGLLTQIMHFKVHSFVLSLHLLHLLLHRLELF